MGRMHSNGKGISKSARPYRRAPPSWLKTTAEDVEAHICKLAKKGMSPSQIGVLLRDSHGIAQVKSVTGTKILRILKKNGSSAAVRPRQRQCRHILGAGCLLARLLMCPHLVWCGDGRGGSAVCRRWVGLLAGGVAACLCRRLPVCRDATAAPMRRRCGAAVLVRAVEVTGSGGRQAGRRWQ